MSEQISWTTSVSPGIDCLEVLSGLDLGYLGCRLQSLAWSPDGKELWFTGECSQLHVYSYWIEDHATPFCAQWRLDGGGLSSLPDTTPPESWPRSLLSSCDGRLELVLIESRGTLRRRDDGAPIGSIDLVSEPLAASFNPRHPLLALLFDDHLEILDVSRLLFSLLPNASAFEILDLGARAWKSWRSLNPATRPVLARGNLAQRDLRGFALAGTVFFNTNLRRADLRGADLKGADFSFADLREANLTHSDLSDAIFLEARLSGALLAGANLRGANLVRADLNEADLARADLEEATVGWTLFGNVDLKETRGLDRLQHKGPSTIGIDTIDRSKNAIPVSFLREAGVADAVLARFRDLIAGETYYSCFISYSHADKKFAQALYDALQKRGVRCWLDEHQLRPGDNILDMIDEGIRLWDKVLLCCSGSSLQSWWVDSEIEKALAKERLLRQRGAKTSALIPLDLDGTVYRWQSGKASLILERFIADFVGWEEAGQKFEAQMERVVAALRAGEGAREAPPPSRLDGGSE